MKFASDNERRAVMAKLKSGRVGLKPRIPRRRQSPTYRTRDRAGCWWRVDRALSRAERAFEAADWSEACHHYHQAAEQACYGAGGRGRHNITDLLRSLNAPAGVRRAGGHLNRFRRGDEYASEEEVQTGRLIEPSVVDHTKEVAQRAKEDMRVVVEWCRERAKAEDVAE